MTRDEIKSLKIISCECENDLCFKPASYDLRLGQEYMLPGPSGGAGDRGHPTVKFCSAEKPLIIPAFSSALVSTYEKVVLPLNVVGRFNLRVKMAFRGLVVQMGTQVEPGYSGRLFAIIQNITEEPVQIGFADYDTRPFTIEFQYTTQKAQLRDGDKKDYEHINQVMPDGFPPAIDSIVKEVRSTTATVNSTRKTFVRWGPIGIPIVASVMLALVTLFAAVIAPIIIEGSSKTIAEITNGAIIAVYGDRVSGLETWRSESETNTSDLRKRIDAANASIAQLRDQLRAIELETKSEKTKQESNGQ